MSTETAQTETPETPEKASLPNETVRPPDPFRDAKNNPTRPGFREKANQGSKALRNKAKAKKKK